MILSGTGHDGTLGAKAIKEKGGLTIAQRPTQRAALSGHAGHAIASGAIDLKLPVQDMAGKLIEYAQGLGTLDPERPDATSAPGRIADGAPGDLRDPARRARAQFRGYKERTFLRRIERRMQVLDLRDLDDMPSAARRPPGGDQAVP
jgi:two-component system CheB/CheR fusion protein